MRYIYVAFIMVVSSCVTSYQPDGFSGGYTDRKVGQNKFMVSFRGNGYTSRSTVEQYAYQRAQEVCDEHGFDDYELIQQSDSDDQFSTAGQLNCSTYYGNTSCTHTPGATITKNTVNLFFSCSNRATTVSTTPAVASPKNDCGPSQPCH